jgi:hypothetical protein
MANPYQPPKAPVGDQPAGQPKAVMPLAAAVAVASIVAIPLIWISALLAAALAAAIIPGASALRVPLYYTLEFAFVFGFVYLCCLLAIFLSASNPYLAALPVGLICSALEVWEGLRIFRTGEATFWYYLALVLLPLAAATAAALIRARGRKQSPR